MSLLTRIPAKNILFPGYLSQFVSHLVPQPDNAEYLIQKTGVTVEACMAGITLASLIPVIYYLLVYFSCDWFQLLVFSMYILSLVNHVPCLCSTWIFKSTDVSKTK